MKKTIILALSLSTLLSFSGCFNSSSSQNNNETTSTEVVTQPATEAKIDHDKIYKEYIEKHIIPEHGIYTAYEIETEPLHQVGTYANPGCWCSSNGILSVKISDLNSDNTPELIVPYIKKDHVDFPDNPDLSGDNYFSLCLKIITYDGKEVKEIYDVRLTETVDYQWQDFQMFISESNENKYLCFNQTVIHGDFGPDTKILFMSMDDKNNVTTDILYAPTRSVNYSLYRLSSLNLSEYKYNNSYFDYSCEELMNKQFSTESYQETENEYWNLYETELNKYKLSLGEAGFGVFRQVKSIVGENFDAIFSIHSDLEKVEKATIKDYTNIISEFTKNESSKNEETATTNSGTVTPTQPKPTTPNNSESIVQNDNNLNNNTVDQPKENTTSQESIDTNVQNNTDNTIQQNIPQGNYRDDFINMLLSNESLWYDDAGNSDSMSGYSSAISFADLNFDGNLELIMRYGGGSSDRNPASIFYYSNGQITKANVISNFNDFNFEDTLEIHYDQQTKKYRIFGKAFVTEMIGITHTYNYELIFDGTNIDCSYFSAFKNTAFPENTYSDYRALPDGTTISEYEYNKIQEQYMTNCQNANMQREFIFCRDWNNYSDVQKREALYNSYNNFKYNVF